MKVAIVGAGMAGAACARALADTGIDVELFDKGRSVGGRLAQRRVEQGVFDHGAQYLAARHPAFTAAVDAWRSRGIVTDWPGVASSSGTPVQVGVPSMNAPVKALLADLPAHTRCRIEKISHVAGAWSLVADDGRRYGPFAALVAAVPAPQAVALLATAGEGLVASLILRLGGVSMAPCWSALAAFTAPLGLGGPTVRFQDGPLAWAGCNASKPGRGTAETWTLHATPEWSRDWLEREPGDIGPALLDALGVQLGRTIPRPSYLAAHRWRYALVERALGEPCLWDPALRLGLCGDWCLGPRVEAAFLSGMALAERMAPGLANPTAPL